MRPDSTQNAVARRRQEWQLSQQDLARRAGISRQALGGIEAGRAVPSAAVALRLARALGCRVEDLFWLDEPDLEARLAGPPALPAPDGTREDPGRPVRLAMGLVRGRWVAHPLHPDQPGALTTAADGLLERGQDQAQAQAQAQAKSVSVVPLRPLAALRDNVLISGCDPALGLLSARLQGAGTGGRLGWVHASSTTALEALRRGDVHLAGAHLLDEESGDFNAPFVRRLLPGLAALLVNLASWEEGFVLLPGNPRSILQAADLARPDVQIVNREPGAGARLLLDRELRRAKVPAAQVRGYDRIVRSHAAVAQAVRLGAADAGVATRSAAAALGLHFVPLAQERFDVVVPAELAEEPRVGRVLDGMASRAFQMEVGSLTGYTTTCCGQVIAEVGSS